MEHSRCDDTSSVKKAITQYLLFDTTEALDPPISPGEKIGRGWSHPVTAALLCPLEYPATDRYASNSLFFVVSSAACSTYADIQSGRKPVTSELFPRFLYPDDQEYDENDLENGILRGHLMTRVSVLISFFLNTDTVLP